MKNRRKRLIMRISILSVFALLIGFVLYQNFTKNSGVVNAGDMAPDFKLETLDGETIQLSDYRGQGVFLNVWATYCKPCEKEMPFIENQYQIFKDKGVQVLSVDVGESAVTVQAFVDRKGMTFPVLMDYGEELLDAYGIGPIPVTFLIDENGRVVDRITAGMTEKEIHGYMKRIQPDDWKESDD
ncbi:thiol-disulfide oxidoreductase ResA [Halobacillus amylolyticus]|uniref:Thiol-disulfide oxidoreductase ResA n=1 Tax=Halobacillus amylolyticus TaxID=2932259 RepID=A0ABY4HGS4_9BACI|nr:thiol-disulfide oxidoreductase ResA [Halobacillus amylolyticus]UOR14126.1 thiol-disulfide oxidoreductase ResA [Halobacillus amylolyticus]